VSRRRQAVGSTRWFGSVMFSHEATKITKLILFSDREAFLRDFASLCEKNFGIWFFFPNATGHRPARFATVRCDRMFGFIFGITSRQVAKIARKRTDYLHFSFADFAPLRETFFPIRTTRLCGGTPSAEADCWESDHDLQQVRLHTW
jgi:hypothetical protein